jgi:hypothetical protein
MHICTASGNNTSKWLEQEIPRTEQALQAKQEYLLSLKGGTSGEEEPCIFQNCICCQKQHRGRWYYQSPSLVASYQPAEIHLVAKSPENHFTFLNYLNIFKGKFLIELKLTLDRDKLKLSQVKKL